MSFYIRKPGCALGSRWPAFLAVMTLVGVPASVVADVPNPDFSTCLFPNSLPGSTTPVTVEVTVRKGESRPIQGAFVQVSILVESGALAPGQMTAASLLSDANGHALVTFTEGIVGEGEVRLRVWADGIQLFTSELYRLSAPVPTRPSTWGRIKTMYAMILTIINRRESVPICFG
jgi:hypothetical protein